MLPNPALVEPAPRTNPGPSRKTMLALVAVALLGPAFLAGAVLFRHPAEPLPMLGAVPPFSLTSQAGQPFGTEQLLGHVWVGNFIFTRCDSVCPPFTAKMLTLEKKTAESLPGLRLVSFSMEPEYDTPAVLTAYAALKQANTARWTFLTGTQQAMEDLVVKGLFQPMEKGKGTLMGIGHSTRFVLVDAKGQIRGFYPSKEEGAVSRLLHDAEVLTAEARR